MTTTINASNSGSGGLVQTADASGILALQTAGTTAVTINASQNVGVGTASPTQKVSIAGGLSFNSALSFSGSGYEIGQDGAAFLAFSGGSAGTRFINASTATEWMRIDSSGNLMVNTTTANYSATQGFGVAAGTGTYAFVSHASGTGSSSDYIAFSYAGTRIGNITQNGTTGVLYNLTSDYRLKNNPVALTGAKDFVMALQPKTWDWWDGSGKGVGFIAHEFMEVAKYSGFGEKDAVDADNKPIHQAIQPSSSEVMANLVAFVQEQQALITSLTARIAALEGTPA